MAKRIDITTAPPTYILISDERGELWRWISNIPIPPECKMEHYVETKRKKSGMEWVYDENGRLKLNFTTFQMYNKRYV